MGELADDSAFLVEEGATSAASPGSTTGRGHLVEEGRVVVDNTRAVSGRAVRDHWTETTALSDYFFDVCEGIIECYDVFEDASTSVPTRQEDIEGVWDVFSDSEEDHVSFLGSSDNVQADDLVSVEGLSFVLIVAATALVVEEDRCFSQPAWSGELDALLSRQEILSPVLGCRVEHDTRASRIDV